MPSRSLWLLLAALAAGCNAPAPSASSSGDAASGAPALSAEPSQPPSAIAPPADADAGAEAAAADDTLVMIAGGDIDLSRGTGKRILREPSWDPFYDVRPLLLQADLRFANLESPLSDQNGETGHKDNPLVFTGPPGGAEVLTRGGFDVVSTANNHAWDYGKRGLCETLQNLDRVGIAHVGTHPDGDSPIGPLLLDRKGHKLAFFAMTAIFNDGPANLKEPRKYVAPANLAVLRQAVAAVRDKVDWVVVSCHIGQEYADEPVQIYRQLLSGAVEAGADVVLGHHTHTPQRIEFHKGVPIVYSMGNFVFHQHSEHPWTGYGYLARVTLKKGNGARVEACPYHLLSTVPHPANAGQESAFVAHMKAISVGNRAALPTRRADDGCWSMEAPR